MGLHPHGGPQLRRRALNLSSSSRCGTPPTRPASSSTPCAAPSSRSTVASAARSSASAYFMKSPPVQYHDDVAHAIVEAFAAGETQDSWPPTDRGLSGPALAGASPTRASNSARRHGDLFENYQQLCLVLDLVREFRGSAQRARWISAGHEEGTLPSPTKASTRMRSVRRPHAHHGQGAAHAEEHATADGEVCQLGPREGRRAAGPRTRRPWRGGRWRSARRTRPPAVPVLLRPVAERQSVTSASKGQLAGTGGLAVAGTRVAAHRAVVDQSNGPARPVAFTHGQLRVAVDRRRQLAHTRRHVRTQQRPVDVLAHAALWCRNPRHARDAYRPAPGGRPATRGLLVRLPSAHRHAQSARPPPPHPTGPRPAAAP